MILKIFAIYDDAVKEYTGPIPHKTPAEAERFFKSQVNNPQNGNLHKFPENFTLFEMGDYDTEQGTLRGLTTPHSIVKAVSLKETAVN